MAKNKGGNNQADMKNSGEIMEATNMQGQNKAGGKKGSAGKQKGTNSQNSYK